MELQNPCNGVGSSMSHPTEGNEKKNGIEVIQCVRCAKQDLNYEKLRKTHRRKCYRVFKNEKNSNQSGLKTPNAELFFNTSTR